MVTNPNGFSQSRPFFRVERETSNRFTSHSLFAPWFTMALGGLKKMTRGSLGYHGHHPKSRPTSESRKSAVLSGLESMSQWLCRKGLNTQLNSVLVLHKHNLAAFYVLNCLFDSQFKGNTSNTFYSNICCWFLTWLCFALCQEEISTDKRKPAGQGCHNMEVDILFNDKAVH